MSKEPDRIERKKAPRCLPWILHRFTTTRPSFLQAQLSIMSRADSDTIDVRILSPRSATRRLEQVVRDEASIYSETDTDYTQTYSDRDDDGSFYDNVTAVAAAVQQDIDE